MSSNIQSGARILRASDLYNKPGKTPGKIGVSKAHLYSMVGRGEFPRPRCLTENGRCKGWPEAQVDEWMMNLRTSAVKSGASQMGGAK
jgi:predicted DNA-binding transcriptional regulator AlpA